MRRWIASMTALVVLAASMCSMPAASAAQVSATVRGEGADEEKAQEDARLKSVRKLLELMNLPSSDEPGSIFQTILGSFLECTSKPSIKQKGKDGGKVYLIGTVSVDRTKLEDMIKEMVQPMLNTDKSVCFFIRAQGATDESRLGAYHKRISEVCGDTFQRRGFQTSVEDTVMREMGQYSAMPYEEFCRAMLQKIRRDYPEVTVAIIGEIAVAPGVSDGTGFAKKGDVRIRAVDLASGMTVADFKELYQVKRRTEDEASLMLLEKCASEASETLAGKVMVYLYSKRK